MKTFEALTNELKAKGVDLSAFHELKNNQREFGF